MTALLVDPNDEAALTNSLEKLLDDPAQRKAMSAAGCQRVLRYDAPVVARQFLDAIGIGSASTSHSRSRV